MLNNNSNKIRDVKPGKQMLQAPQTRPRLLHNGINGQKGGTNAKGTPKAVKRGIHKGDVMSQAVSALRKKKS